MVGLARRETAKFPDGVIQTAMIENGFVHIPESAPWLAEYLHEMTVFPNGKHDDQADSTAQFLDWVKTPMPCWGIYEHTRRMPKN